MIDYYMVPFFTAPYVVNEHRAKFVISADNTRLELQVDFYRSKEKFILIFGKKKTWSDRWVIGPQEFKKLFNCRDAYYRNDEISRMLYGVVAYVESKE